MSTSPPDPFYVPPAAPVPPTVPVILTPNLERQITPAEKIKGFLNALSTFVSVLASIGLISAGAAAKIGGLTGTIGPYAAIIGAVLASALPSVSKLWKKKQDVPSMPTQKAA